MRFKLASMFANGRSFATGNAEKSAILIWGIQCGAGLWPAGSRGLRPLDGAGRSANWRARGPPHIGKRGTWPARGISCTCISFAVGPSSYSTPEGWNVYSWSAPRIIHFVFQRRGFPLDAQPQTSGPLRSTHPTYCRPAPVKNKMNGGVFLRLSL